MSKIRFSQIDNLHIQELQQAHMNLQEQIDGLEALFTKVSNELLTEITSLETKLSVVHNGAIPSGVQDSIDRFKQKLETLDARNPDAAPVTDTQVTEQNNSAGEGVEPAPVVNESPVAPVAPTE
jgi:hypothetical protein